MPFTPYHFGPGLAIKAVIPRHFSFTVFCFAQIVTDLETAYYILGGEYPLHRWLHSYVGASAVALACVFIGRPLCQIALGHWGRWERAPFKRYFFSGDRISVTSAIVGAFIGTYSHVFLDSIIHADIIPLSPFSEQNAIYRIVDLFALHVLCIALGIFGLWLLSSRSRN